MLSHYTTRYRYEHAAKTLSERTVMKMLDIQKTYYRMCKQSSVPQFPLEPTLCSKDRPCATLPLCLMMRYGESIVKSEEGEWSVKLQQTRGSATAGRELIVFGQVTSPRSRPPTITA